MGRARVFPEKGAHGPLYACDPECLGDVAPTIHVPVWLPNHQDAALIIRRVVQERFELVPKWTAMWSAVPPPVRARGGL